MRTSSSRLAQKYTLVLYRRLKHTRAAGLAVAHVSLDHLDQPVRWTARDLRPPRVTKENKASKLSKVIRQSDASLPHTRNSATHSCHIRIVPMLYNGPAHVSVKSARSRGDLDPRLKQNFFVQHEPASETASRSDQPFSHSSPVCPAHRPHYIIWYVLCRKRPHLRALTADRTSTKRTKLIELKKLREHCGLLYYCCVRYTETVGFLLT